MARPDAGGARAWVGGGVVRAEAMVKFTPLMLVLPRVIRTEWEVAVFAFDPLGGTITTV